MTHLSSALVGRFARGDLFDQLDNAAPELGVGDARERTGQGEAFGGCEKIGNVSRRGSFAAAVGTCGAAGSSLEQKRYRDLEYFGYLLNAAGADRRLICLTGERVFDERVHGCATAHRE